METPKGRALLDPIGLRPQGREDPLGLCPWGSLAGPPIKAPHLVAQIVMVHD